MSIRIAEACRGQHSLIGLVITSIIVGHVLLSEKRTRAVAVITMVPIVRMKTAVRTVVLFPVAVHRGEEVFVSMFHKVVGFPSLPFF